MRYGAMPSNFPEWIAMRLEKVPIPILDVLLGPTLARAFMAAERIGALTELAKGAATTGELAARLRVDAECLRLVLRVVRSMGYVDLRGESWSLTATGRRYFGPDAVEPYHAFVEYGAPQWDMIGKLDAVLKSGAGIDFHDNQTDEEWDVYQRAMFENARGFAWFVAENMPVPAGAKTCLDIAGSHGWVGVELSKKHPGLASTVFDRKEALQYAKKIAEKNGYASSLSFREGDLRKDDFGKDVDVVLMCNILHHSRGDENRTILERVRKAMKPGGSIGIFEIETPRDDAPPDAAGDALALYFRITSTSSCFRGDDYLGWLKAAGFSDARVVRSVRMPSRMLVVARA